MENNKIIVAGGGHAGIEAALAISKMGYKCGLVTLNKDAIGRMSCNPAIGGLAKGHLVREIDALGGIMGRVTDQSTLQYKTLNKSKGRAVWSPRAQIDKIEYTNKIQTIINTNKNITVIEDEIIDFIIKDSMISGVLVKSGIQYKCKALIITCGTFMSGLIHIGSKKFLGGRIGEKRSHGLTESLKNKGFLMGRLKTGTPPRANAKSINFNKLELAYGDKEAFPFSLFTKKPYKPNNIPCYLAYTSSLCHKIIKENIHLSAMFSGQIDGVGPRYCPSVEDKIIRFTDKEKHQLFLEPEWKGSEQIYINGFSTSLPEQVQILALKSIPGLESVELIRPGYAIEYDYMPSHQLKASLETKKIGGLFSAGQINGTSGYEEAAAQGLIAGINAVHYIKNNEPLILNRSNSYIGVMIDDLVTKHINEPYRMFTSRAENRLSLRSDTAHLRLCEAAFANNMLTKQEFMLFKKFKSRFDSLMNKTKKTTLIYNKKTEPLYSLIKRPEISLINLNKRKKINSLKLDSFDFEVVFAVETAIKYEGYEKRELIRNSKIKKMEGWLIPQHIQYNNIKNLSTESKEKLTIVRPETLGQASRIGGVRPSDIAVLSLYLKTYI